MINPHADSYSSINLSEKPKLLVVIDTEEAFDWSRDFSRDQITVKSMRYVNRIQEIFDEFQITPVYVVDYPIVSQKEGFQPLQEIHDSGRCLIGAHLHPWVNPPFEEEVSQHHSFPGNLPPELEYAKLQILGDSINKQFGTYPSIYKAGRYGIGPRSTKILETLGYKIDLSVCPHMDYSSEGGPDFSKSTPFPSWFGEDKRILELPLTVGFSGVLRPWGKALHHLASRPIFSSLHIPGIMARLRLLNKSWLSPEGYILSEQIALVRALVRDGLKVFSFAFHSPSLEVGNTPYVRSQADLEKFLSNCRDFFEFFMGELGGHPTTPLELRELLLDPKNTISSEVL